MSVRTKIVVLLSSVLVFGAAAAGFGVLTLLWAGGELKGVAEDHVPLMSVLSRVSASHLEQSLRFERSLRFGASPKSADYQRARSEFETLAAEIWNELQSGRAIAERSMHRAGGAQAEEGARAILVLLGRLDLAHNDYAAYVREVFARFDSGHRQDRRLTQRVERQDAHFDELLGDLLVEVSGLAEAASARAKANERQAILVTGVLSALAILMGVVAVVFCVRLVSEIRSLTGLLPICASCKRIRDDQGYWNQLELYLERYSDAEFTHGICQECQKQLIEKMNSGGPGPPGATPAG